MFFSFMFFRHRLPTEYRQEGQLCLLVDDLVPSDCREGNSYFVV